MNPIEIRQLKKIIAKEMQQTYNKNVTKCKYSYFDGVYAHFDVELEFNAIWAVTIELSMVNIDDCEALHQAFCYTKDPDF